MIMGDRSGLTLPPVDLATVRPGCARSTTTTPGRTAAPTDVDHARLLCPHHHRRLHDKRYAATLATGDKLRFHRRT